MSSKTPVKGLQTAPDKRGKIKNCTQGKSYPCGKACLSLGSAILEGCLKGLKATEAQKAKELGKSLSKGGKKKKNEKLSNTSTNSQKPISDIVNGFTKKQKKFKDLLDNLSNPSDEDKIKIIATAKKLIDEQFNILKEHGAEAFNKPTIQTSSDPQHNIIPPPIKPTIELVGELVSGGILWLGDVKVDLKNNKELKEKINFISKIESNNQDWKKSTEEMMERYKDSVKGIAKQTGVSEERAKELFDSVRNFTGGFYKGIREVDEGKSNNKNYIKDAKNINEFLTKFKPKYEGTVYRGMTVDKATKAQIINSLRNGTFTHPAMSSYSSNKDIASGFAYAFSENDESIIFVNKSRSGVSIKNISRVDTEDEILIPKGTKIRMSGEPYQENGKTYIPVEEVD